MVLLSITASTGLFIHHNNEGVQTFGIASESLAQALHLSWQNLPGNFPLIHYHQSTSGHQVSTKRIQSK